MVVFTILITLANGNTGCGGGTSSSTNESVSGEGQTYLASNILFRSAEAAARTTRSATTDETIYADQVLMSEAELGVEADTLEEYAEATTPDLSATIVGTWSISVIGDSSDQENDPGFTSSGGSISFSADETFDVSSATADMFDNIPNVGDELTSVSRNSPSYTYRVIDNMVLVLRSEYTARASCNGDCNGETPNDGDSCSCGGDGAFHDVACYGACTETYGSAVPPDFTNYDYNRYIIYTATATKINLGSVILTKE